MMLPTIKPLMDLMKAPQPKGLNKIAVANIHLQGGKPYKAIRALENPLPGYQEDEAAQRALLAKLKAQFPDWERQEQADRPLSIWQRLAAKLGL